MAKIKGLNKMSELEKDKSPSWVNSKKEIKNTSGLYGLGSIDKIKKILQWSILEVSAINKRFLEISDLLKEMQPKSNGAIMLEVQNCNAKDQCTGCPHLVWSQWSYITRNGKQIWSRHQLKDSPINRFNRSGGFEKYHDQCVVLAQEAIRLNERKKSIIKNISSLGKIRTNKLKNDK